MENSEVREKKKFMTKEQRIERMEFPKSDGD